MRLRYAGTCRVCGSELPAKTDAVYERTSGTVRCVSHPVSVPVVASDDDLHPSTPDVDPGMAGASARREFERRKAARELLDPEVPVHGVLCFVEADWPLLGGDFTTRDVHALWPKKLYPKLQGQGALTIDTIAGIHRVLAQALPAA
jgi:hypothetical protein